VTALLFPDNTVLVNFALIDRMDLFALVAGSHGRWCATVARECANSAKEPGLDSLNLVGGILGDPLYPEGTEHLQVSRFRSELASPGDERHKHLGEAETLAILTSRDDLYGAFVTDDADAARLAQREGIKVYSTWDLLALLRRTGKITENELLGFFDVLQRERRRLPDGVRVNADFLHWLQLRGC
jgi:hypothetical protein